MKAKLLFTAAACLSTILSMGQCLESVYTGDGTYYSYSGGGNCSFPNPYTQLYSAALNAPQYGTSQLCGACAEVTGPRGTITVSLEDQCPECAHGDLDFEQEAFPLLADPVDGRVEISWKIVPCPVSGPVSFHFKEGSNQWWTAVQVRNHRYPISKFEFKNSNGTFVQVARESYNYFVATSGMGVGPYDFRVTDILGQVLEFDNIPFQENTTFPGDKQFDLCSVTSIQPNADTYNINVYPNPSADKTRCIRNHEAFVLEVELYDLVGRKITKGSVNANAEMKIELPESGTFILKITGPNGETHFKTLVNH